MPTRRQFLSVLAAAPLFAQARRPNIVWIVADDMGYGDVGCYGAKDAKTPHIDALAAAGVRLTSFYANAPMCSPTRASLLTGRYPYRCSVPFVVSSARDVVGLKGDEVTAAEAFRDAGYRTGLIGKWHLGTAEESLPNSQGFDDFFGFRSGCVDYYSHRFYWGLGANYPSFHDLYRNGDEVWHDGEYATELITREARRFLGEQRGNEPFFLTVNYNAPHYPMHAPRKYVERFGDLDPERKMHLALVAALDDGVGELVAELKSSGHWDNTFLFFFSDNGATIENRAGFGGRNTPFRGWKFSLFEGGIRMPAIGVWPGHIPGGSESAEMAASMDLFPTCAALAGAHVPVDRVIDGRDILPALDGTGPTPHEALFWKRYNQVAVRKGEWKLVLNGIEALGPEHELQREDRAFLVNLQEDPSETRNRIRDYPDIADELRERISRWEIDVSGG